MLSSTTDMSKKLIFSDNKPNLIADPQGQKPTIVNFTFDKEEEISDDKKLEFNLQHLDESLKSRLVLKTGSVSLNELEQEFKTLCEIHGDIVVCTWLTPDEQKEVLEQRKILSGKERNIIEEYKLAIIRSLQKHLQKKYNFTRPQILSLVMSPSWWRYLLYILLAISNVLFMTIGGFIGMQQVITDIFHVASAFILYPISGFLASIECLLYYSTIAQLLKKGLGIPEDPIDKTVMTIYDEQLEAVLTLNEWMCKPQCYNKMTALKYKEHTNVANLFNYHIANIKANETEKNIYSTIYRWFLSSFNAVLTIANSYFLANSLLKTIAVTLIGTSLGWSIIGGIIAIQLVNSFVIRSQGVYEMLYPHELYFKNVRAKIASFSVCDTTFKGILSNKKALNKEKAIIAPEKLNEILKSHHRLQLYRKVRFERAPIYPNLEISHDVGDITNKNITSGKL